MILYQYGEFDLKKSYDDISKEYLDKFLDKKQKGRKVAEAYKYLEWTPHRNIYSYCEDKGHDAGKVAFLKEFVENNFKLLNEIILAKPSQFENLKSKVYELEVKHGLDNLNIDESKNWRDKIQDLMGYGKFDSNIGRNWFMNKMNIPVCPYCNLQIHYKKFSADKKRILELMEIDHFLMKSKYPLFSMSFFNLIPVCLLCNQRLKKHIDTCPSTHTHPYLDSLDSLAKFQFVPALSLYLNKVSVSFKSKDPSSDDGLRADLFIQEMQLEEIYQHFEDDVLKLRTKYDRYKRSIKRIGLIQNYIMKLMNLEVERILDENDFNDFKELENIPIDSDGIRFTPYGKLKLDVFNELDS